MNAKVRVRVADKSVIRSGESQTPVGVRIKYKDGKVSELMLADLSETMRLEAICHGLLQKGGDAYSGEPDPTLARGLTEAVFDAIRGGDWNRKAPGTNLEDLIQAVAKVSGHSVEETRVALSKASEEDRKKAAKIPAVAVIMDELRLARRKAGAKGKPGKSELGKLFA